MKKRKGKSSARIKPEKKQTKKISKRTRVQTGVSIFDNLIEGGFNKDSTNLLIGGAGCGKSIFATEFLVNGIKRGERGLYITFEETKEEFYNNMSRFGWPLQEYEKKGDFVFLEYTPEKVKTMLEEGGGAIENIILRNKIARVVIDSITSFELLFDNELEKREAAFQLFNMISKWNCTCLVTFEGDVRSDKGGETRTIEFEADSIVAMYFVRNLKKRQRFVEVIKMRGTQHSTEIHPFSIENTGIKIEKRPYKGKLET